MKATGKVVGVFDRREGMSSNGQGFVKQTLVIETLENTPKKMAFEFFGEKWDGKVDKLEKGSMVEVYFEPHCNEYEGKWFTTLKGYGYKEYKAAVPTTEAPVPAAATMGDTDSGLFEEGHKE